MATRKEGVKMSGDYYTDLKKYNAKENTRQMYIMKKAPNGNFIVLGDYVINPKTKKAVRLNWNLKPVTPAAERQKIARIIDIYEGI